MPPKLYVVYNIMKKGNITYTLLALTALTVVVIYFVSIPKPVSTGDDGIKVQVKVAQQKQLVKPDDIVEETIVGSDEQSVIGDQNGRGPMMTII
jgi:hypothetical protein